MFLNLKKDANSHVLVIDMLFFCGGRGRLEFELRALCPQSRTQSHKAGHKATPPVSFPLAVLEMGSCELFA
jgi:hypothetical protein